MLPNMILTKTPYFYPPLDHDDKVWMKGPAGLTGDHMPPIDELNKDV